MIDVKMPALSPTMEKGTLARWLVAPGDRIKVGDMIAEIETDKATLELEAEDEGEIAELRVADGSENVTVGTVIAVLTPLGEGKIERPTPAPSADAPETGTEQVPVVAAEAAAAPEVAAQPLALDQNGHATPLARRMAAIHRIDLAGMRGSGPRGKVTTADLGLPAARAATPAAPMAQPVATPIAPPPEGVPVVSTPLSAMRKTIARRLTESKTQVPHFYLTVRCNLDPLLALRASLNADLAAQGTKLSVNDFLLKALALALEQVPAANVQFGGEVLHSFSRVDVAMAVAIDGGLITPVLRDVGSLSLSGIARASKALAETARASKLRPEDYAGGTVSLSNLGMFGIDEMIPVINPPQALILGTAAGIRLPWDVGGEIQLATIMAATASFDHRAIDGATGAQFMAAFKALVEAPMRLVV